MGRWTEEQKIKESQEKRRLIQKQIDAVRNSYKSGFSNVNYLVIDKDGYNKFGNNRNTATVTINVAEYKAYGLTVVPEDDGNGWRAMVDME